GNIEVIRQWLETLSGNGAERPLLVPTSDVFVEFLLQDADSLSEQFLFPSAYHGLAKELLDKLDFHALCQSNGVPTPGVWQAASFTALAALAPELPYPCILKPALIHRTRSF